MSDEKEKAEFDRAKFDAEMEEIRRVASLCKLCGGDKVQKYKEIREHTQEIEYLCYCPDCEVEYDMFHINDLIYYWSKLPVRRVFDKFSDYRDEGGAVEKYRIDHDAAWDDPKRVVKLWESK